MGLLSQVYIIKRYLTPSAYFFFSCVGINIGELANFLKNFLNFLLNFLNHRAEFGKMDHYFSADVWPIGVITFYSAS